VSELNRSAKKKMSVPKVSSAELIECAKQLFPDEKITQSMINADFGSWQVEIGGKEERRWLEIVWGPLSGFGGTDVKNLPAEDPDIFAPYEIGFGSLEEAKRWLESAAKKKNSFRFEVRHAVPQIGG
jgi:hypothetical protein